MRLTNPIIKCLCFFALFPWTLFSQEFKEVLPFDAENFDESHSIFHHQVKEHSASFTRLIEPISPILGNKLVREIREDDRHPLEIKDAIKSKYKTLQSEILISSVAYFNTLMPGLVSYSKQALASTKPAVGMQWTEVEPAAIPLEVLMPLHEEYILAVDSASVFYQKMGHDYMRDSAISLAVSYGNLKSSCNTVMRALRPNNIYTRVLPKELADLIQLNAVISSAEAAYPRLQHSINGYLQHTYNYLLNHDDLEGLLTSGFDAQVEWIDMAREEETSVPFMSYIERAVLNAGYSYQDALMLLCYSTRNMPNLDVQYIMNDEKALTLEIFFWKFKELQNEAIDNYLGFVFPNHVFKENPMLYHYATASYLAYEVKRAGYRSGTAIGMAFMSKAGYKFHKFVCALDPREMNHKGVDHFKDLIKKQSSLSGVSAGYHGGVHGVAIAKMEQKNQSFQKRQKLLAQATFSSTVE